MASGWTFDAAMEASYARLADRHAELTALEIVQSARRARHDATLTGRAWNLGAWHAREGVPAWNVTDGESAHLMDALDQTDPTTDDNAGDRNAACDAYVAGWKLGRHHPVDYCTDGCAWCADYKPPTERERVALSNENTGPDWSRSAVITGRP